MRSDRQRSTTDVRSRRVGGRVRLVGLVALEHFTRSAAAQLADDGVAVNCLRIDEPVASEGFVANAPELDHSEWAASSVAADCAIWMLGRPASYTGNVVGMAELRAAEGL